jgi:uncharacterized protein (DUF58 family)
VASSATLRSSFDWTSLSGLRLRARAVADGVFAGLHASRRKGSGVEFGGHRAYVPGDDLRLLDRRAMARHDRPYIRELATETERALRIVLDASASMEWKSEGAPMTKLAYAGVLAAALGRVALASGDPVGLELLGGQGARPLPASAGRESFERLLFALESVRGRGNLADDVAAVDRALAPLVRRARRGAVLVLFSDLLDLPDEALRRFAALGTGGRTLVAVQVLDPEEARFPFDGPIRLRGIERQVEVETDPDAVRALYLEALAAITARWSKALEGRGGRVIPAVTDGDPIEVVRAILRAGVEGPR